MDRLDKKLADLLLERLALSLSIIAEKSTLGRPAHDPRREREVIEQLIVDFNPSGVPARLIKKVYREIFRQSVAAAKGPKRSAKGP
jgi:chorismate mutase